MQRSVNYHDTQIFAGGRKQERADEQQANASINCLSCTEISVEHKRQTGTYFLRAWTILNHQRLTHYTRDGVSMETHTNRSQRGVSHAHSTHTHTHTHTQHTTERETDRQTERSQRRRRRLREETKNQKRSGCGLKTVQRNKKHTSRDKIVILWAVEARGVRVWQPREQEGGKGGEELTQ